MNEKENIERELNKLEREVEDVDAIINSYYTNPEAYLEATRNIKPNYKRETLIRKIQNYRIKTKELGGNVVTSLNSLLDRIQWKAHYYNKTWIQWEKIAEDKRDRDGRNNTYSEIYTLNCDKI